MNGRNPVFGRRGADPAHDALDVLDEAAVNGQGPVPSFGKRSKEWLLQPAERGPVSFAAVARMRLAAICKDLNNLYQHAASSDAVSFFRLVSEPDPRLLIGEHGSVTVDLARGLYVLSLQGREPGSITIETDNDERLLDHVICHLAVDRSRYFSATAYGVISSLVGRTLEDVERALILATLRQHHFNRTHAAEILGISVRTVRNKLKAYREALSVVPDASEAEAARLHGPQSGGV